MEEKGLLMMNVVLGIIINYYWLQSSLILDVTIVMDDTAFYNCIMRGRPVGRPSCVYLMDGTCNYCH